MFQEIIAHLTRNKLRTALTGLSVSVGIFLLIVLLGAGNGIIHALEANSGRLGMDVMLVWPGSTSEPYDGLESGRQVRFDDRDMRQLPVALPGRVGAATGQISVGGAMLVNDGKSVSSSLEGLFPDNAQINNVKMLSGRYINALDMRERRKVLVITEKTSNELFGTPEAAVGRQVRVDSLMFTCVGVMSSKGQMGGVSSHVPFSTLQLVYGKGNDVDQLTLRLEGEMTATADSAIQADVRRSLSALHRFSPTDGSAVWMWNVAQGAKETAKALSILRTAFWVIGLLTLLSGVVSISNIMLITVKERTHEFGIRKALGARPWSILRSVMVESVIITLLSGYVGLVCGVAATEYLNYVAGQKVLTVADQEIRVFLDPTVDLSIAINALVVLVVAGMVAGFFPARKAVRVKPIEALNAR